MNKTWKLFWLQTKLGYNLPGLKANMRSFKGIVKNLSILALLVLAVGTIMWTYVYLLNQLIDMTLKATQNMISLQSTIMSVAIFGAMLFVLVMGVIRNMGIYYSKDTEFLASLPIRQRSVYTAKFLHAYAGEIAMFALIVLPPIIILGTKTTVDFLFWVKALVICVLGPMPAFAVSSIIASLLVRVSVLARHRDKIMTYGGFLLIIVYMIGVQYISFGMAEMDTVALMRFITGGLIDFIGKAFPPAIWASHSLMYTGSTGLEAFGLFLAAAALGTALSIVIAGHAFQRGAVAQAEAAKRGKRIDMAKAAGNTRSQFMALFIKEWKTVLRVPIYALNSLISIIMMPIMPIIMFLIPSQQGDGDMEFLIDLIKEPGASLIVIGIAAMFMFFFATLNTAGSTSYSREGQSVWLLQTMPVKAATVARAKLAFALSIVALTCFAGFLSLSFILKMPYEAAIAALMAFVCGIPIIIIGNTTDMFRPKLKWESEQKAIKSNANQFIAVLLTFLYMIGLGYLAYVMISKLHVELTVVYITAVAISLAISAIGYMVMCRTAQARMNKMNEAA